MPLYVHAVTGERKRTVPGQYEDTRCAADESWERVTPATVAQVKAAQAAPTDAEPAAAPARPARRRRAASTTD